MSDTIIKRSPLALDTEFLVLAGPNGSVPLTHQETEVLRRVMRDVAGVSMKVLIYEIYGPASRASNPGACIRQLISRLRKKAAFVGAPGVITADYRGETAYSVKDGRQVLRAERVKRLVCWAAEEGDA